MSYLAIKKLKGHDILLRAEKHTALPQVLSYSEKPEIDLQSWASLGGNAKPSRTERKPKRTWKRRAAR